MRERLPSGRDPVRMLSQLCSKAEWSTFCRAVRGEGGDAAKFADQIKALEASRAQLVATQAGMAHGFVELLNDFDASYAYVGNNGKEIWFTASELGLFHYTTAVNLAKQQRLVTRVPGSLVIFDIWKDGLSAKGSN